MVVVLLILLAIPLLRATKGTSGTAGGAAVGHAAPLFVSTDLSGREVALASYRGRRVVLNFWASWCVPCRAEFPVLKELQTRHPDVVVLGVVFEDVSSAAGGFMQAQGATWPAVQDPRAQISNAYAVYAKPGIPVSILIDASGRIRRRQYGALGDQAAADAFVDLGDRGSPVAQRRP